MRVLDILKFIGELGGRFNIKKLDTIMSYFSQMIADGRVIVIYSASKPVAVLSFSMTDHPLEYLQKDTWTYKPHDVNGKTCYVEQLVSNGWNKDMRQKLENELLTRYPQIEKAIWYRFAKWGDRQVIWKRRIACMK